MFMSGTWARTLKIPVLSTFFFQCVPQGPVVTHRLSQSPCGTTKAASMGDRRPPGKSMTGNVSVLCGTLKMVIFGPSHVSQSLVL